MELLNYSKMDAKLGHGRHLGFNKNLQKNLK